MSEQNPRPVVVAVGHDPIDAALGYAAAEALRTGCGLHLVHVVHLIAQGPEMVLVDAADLDRLGRQTLNAALERAHDLVPDEVRVTSELRMGGVVPSLVEVTRGDVRLMVLQRRSLSRMMRVVTRSVSSGVAAHARVPVVSVPADWTPETRAGEAPVVSVGIDVPDRSVELLRTAAEVARSRGATLRVVHTWSFPGAYDDIIMTRTEHDDWAKKVTEEILELVDSLGDVAEGLSVEIEAEHAYAADALVEAATRSDLLVVGRHDPLVPIGSHLGPVARAVLREAVCPVLLADPRPSRHHRQQDAAPAPATGGQ